MGDAFTSTPQYQSFNEVPSAVQTITMTEQMAAEAATDANVLMKYTQLKELICTGLNLQHLPNLPPTLEKLDCSENGLIALPPLPTALVELNCSLNKLMSLPILPQSLRMLNFSDNGDITSIPDLPPTLEVLSGFNTKLTYLPPLPPTLKTLAMGNGALVELPQLPEGLIQLNVTNNKLTQIPRLPDSLNDIAIGSNKLSNIPNIPTNTQEISCDNNLLIALPPLKFSPNLKTIYCIENWLTTIPDLPDNVTHLICSYNKLTRLPPLPAALVVIWCDHNQITEIPDPIPHTLEECLCNNNKIVQLPPLPTTINVFNCTRNPLQQPPKLITGEYLNLKFDDKNNRISTTPRLALGSYDVPNPKVYAAPTSAANVRLVVFDDCFACDMQQKWLNAAEVKSRQGLGCSINSMRFMNLFNEAEQERLMNAAGGYVTPFSTVIEYTKKHTGDGRHIIEKQFDITTLAKVRALFANLHKWMPQNSCTIFRYSNTSERDHRGVTFGHTVVLSKDAQDVLYVVDPVQNKMIRHNSDKLFYNMQRRGDDVLSLMFEVVVPGRSGGGRRRPRCTRKRRKGRKRKHSRHRKRT